MSDADCVRGILGCMIGSALRCRERVPQAAGLLVETRKGSQRVRIEGVGRVNCGVMEREPVTQNR